MKEREKERNHAVGEKSRGKKSASSLFAPATPRRNWKIDIYEEHWKCEEEFRLNSLCLQILEFWYLDGTVSSAAAD